MIRASRPNTEREKAIFDGWGYVRLFDANSMQEIDQYAIPEALDERFASGFGDLSVHETAEWAGIPTSAVTLLNDLPEPTDAGRRRADERKMH